MLRTTLRVRSERRFRHGQSHLDPFVTARFLTHCVDARPSAAFLYGAISLRYHARLRCMHDIGD